MQFREQRHDSGGWGHGPNNLINTIQYDPIENWDYWNYPLVYDPIYTSPTIICTKWLLMSQNTEANMRFEPAPTFIFVVAMLLFTNY